MDRLALTLILQEHGMPPFWKAILKIKILKVETAALATPEVKIFISPFHEFPNSKDRLIPPQVCKSTPVNTPGS